MADNNEVSITNSTNAAVVTLDAYDPSTTPTGKQAYEQPLTLRPTDTGSQTIAAGATAAVPLDPNRTIYELIFARPADLFPVQDSSLMQGILSGTYPPLTVAATGPAQLTLALQFFVNLLVYPTSNTAVQYQSILSNATQSGSSSSDIETAINNFFQSTTLYKTLTLDAVVAAQTYARSFAYVWAGFASGFTSFNDSITYYLYSAGTPPANSNQAPPTALGTLVLQKKPNPPNPADPTDRTGAYQMTYTAPGGATTDMFYSGGQFVSDVTSDFPAIALRGTFVLKSSLTNQASDNVIIPLLSGQVNGVQAIGTTYEQDGTQHGSFYTFFHPKTFQAWVQLIGTMLGLAMGLEWIGSKCKSVVDWFRNRNNPPQPSEIEQMRDQMNTLGEEIRTNQQQILDRLGNQRAQMPAEQQMQAAQQDARQEAVDANNVARGDAQLDSFRAQAQQVEVVAQVEVNPQLQQAASQIREGASSVESALKPGVSSSELAEAVNNGASVVEHVQPQIDDIVQQVSEQIGEQGLADIKQAKQVSEEARQVDEEAKENAEDSESGEGMDEDAPIEG